ncbi:MFS transporter [Arthrobacter sp. ISL-5]|uniref:MFS transporter n=1 Tax=Arthrobacter sp. ISL-5 TaxID=2819111 RepID=UPI001BE65674|nr:MFS transporter [Arthrobacter sp. ISL-5]MBT2555966.1 MFS transporter [Arthrobacter sp. ISL-5]
MTKGLTLLFAIAGGLAVGNLYWAQSLLDLIAGDLHASTSAAGWLVTATQLGYAAGVLLIVPLGDALNRHRLIPAMVLCSALALAACAVSPTMLSLLVAVTAVGVSTVAGQLLTPLAGDLASDRERGRVVGTVVSGLLTGILVSRTVSGLVADAVSWRAVFGLAAVAALVVAGLLYRANPGDACPESAALSGAYGFGRRGGCTAGNRAVDVGLGCDRFREFHSLLDRAHLPPQQSAFQLPPSVIGLFGLAGLVGAIAAQRVGRLHDRGWSLATTGAALLLLLITFAFAALGGGSIVVILVAVVVLDLAAQSVNVLNQIRMFAIPNEGRSRLNTAFVTTNFLGGAVGSAAAAVMWAAGGWVAVMVIGMVFSAIALVVWTFGRRGPLQVPTPQ